MTRTWQSIALFPIPSVIYWIHNNVQVRRQLCCAAITARYVPLYNAHHTTHVQWRALFSG